MTMYIRNPSLPYYPYPPHRDPSLPYYPYQPHIEILGGRGRSIYYIIKARNTITVDKLKQNGFENVRVTSANQISCEHGANLVIKRFERTRIYPPEINYCIIIDHAVGAPIFLDQIIDKLIKITDPETVLYKAMTRDLGYVPDLINFDPSNYEVYYTRPSQPNPESPDIYTQPGYIVEPQYLAEEETKSSTNLWFIIGGIILLVIIFFAFKGGKRR